MSGSIAMPARRLAITQRVQSLLRSAGIMALTVSVPVGAQRVGSAPPANADSSTARWDVTQARGKTRDINFVANEGTWMSADFR